MYIHVGFHEPVYYYSNTLSLLLILEVCDTILRQLTHAAAGVFWYDARGSKEPLPPIQVQAQRWYTCTARDVEQMRLTRQSLEAGG